MIFWKLLAISNFQQHPFELGVNNYLHEVCKPSLYNARSTFYGERVERSKELCKQVYVILFSACYANIHWNLIFIPELSLIFFPYNLNNLESVRIMDLYAYYSMMINILKFWSVNNSINQKLRRYSSNRSRILHRFGHRPQHHWQFTIRDICLHGRPVFLNSNPFLCLIASMRSSHRWRKERDQAEKRIWIEKNWPPVQADISYRELSMMLVYGWS